MCHRLCLRTLACCLVLAAGSSPALAQDVGAAATGQRGQASADARDSYSALKAQEDARAGDPAYDLALGQAAADAGRNAEAIIAFQRVLALDPGNSVARAELARAYAQAGDIDTARDRFRTVLDDPTVPDPVRRRIDGLVGQLDRQAGEGGVEVTGYVDAEAGWDSNINTATDALSLTLPLFAFLGPATLNAAARETDDAFFQLQGGVSVSAPISRQTRLFASALGNYRDNIDFDFVDQAGIVGSAGISHALAGGDAISLTGQVQRFLLDGDGYRTSYGAVGQYTKRIGQGDALAVALQYYRLDYDGNPLADVDRYAASVTYAGRNLFAGLGGGVEETVRPGARQLGYAFASGQLGGEFPLGERLAFVGGISAEYRDYEAQDPLFLQSREDIRFDASAGVRFALTDRLSVRPRATYTVNESNLALYDYDRFTASVGVRFEF